MWSGGSTHNYNFLDDDDDDDDDDGPGTSLIQASQK